MAYISFDGGIYDGSVYELNEEERLEPCTYVQSNGKLHEYRLVDTFLNEETNEKTYKYRFEKILPIGTKKIL